MRIRRIRTGTANPNFRHGNSLRGKVSPEYHAYNSAKRRCKDSRREDFKNYGGRGIKFLFKSFQEFLAAIGKKPSRKHMLDRIDNDGHYKPGNVRWSTRSESMKNRRMTKHWLHFLQNRPMTPKRLRACRRNAALARKYVTQEPVTGRLVAIKR